MEKILIIRFSSIGDVLQTLSVAGALQNHFPTSEIHWVTRQDMVPLIEHHPAIRKVWSMDRNAGIRGLWRLAQEIRRERFTRVYDAHNNLRSRILALFLFGMGHFFIRRPMYRWKRFVLFRFRKNLFAKPFNGQADLLRPLLAWGVPIQPPAAPQLFLPEYVLSGVTKHFEKWQQQKFVALAPSAAYPLKRWPIEHWKELIRLWKDQLFFVLGGPEDRFLEELTRVDPERVINWAGKLNLLESAALVRHSQMLIANDTGMLHVAEQLGVKAVALMGPAPFGFPSRPTTRILEVELPCRPCSKHGQGPCKNPEFQKCLVDIRPEMVLSAARG